jgi:hypothetical protein
MRLEAASRQLDELELKVERQLNELLRRHTAIFIDGPGAGGPIPNRAQREVGNAPL